MVKRIFNSIVAIISFLMVLALIIGCASTQPAPPTASTPAVTTPAAPIYSIATPKLRFKIATTTSLYDTGLWYYLEPLFETKANVELDIVYAGTGAAINQGKSGEVH